MGFAGTVLHRSPQVKHFVKNTLNICSKHWIGERGRCYDCLRTAIEKVKAERLPIYKKQGGRCAGCCDKFPVRQLTLDHIIPKGKGGKDTFENKQLLCHPCNMRKATNSMDSLKGALAIEREIPDWW